MEALGGDEEAEALLGVAYAARQCEELLAGGAPGSTSTRSTARPATRAVLARAARLAAVGARRAEPERAASTDAPRDDARARGSFRYSGHRIAYADYGEGERVLVLAHGLLMNRHMYDHLAPEMASRGYRVITVDLLGHGALGQARPTCAPTACPPSATSSRR